MTEHYNIYIRQTEYLNKVDSEPVDEHIETRGKETKIAACSAKTS